MTPANDAMATYAKPAGLGGYFAGWKMAWSPSQKSVNEWALSLVSVTAQERILEIGCGPGLLMAACIKKASKGQVVGLDHSKVMVGQARRRNSSAIKQGTAKVFHANVTDINPQLGTFDKIFMIDVVQYLPDLVAAYLAASKVLAPGGTIATAFSLRLLDDQGDKWTQLSHHVQKAMSKAGLAHIVTAQQKASRDVRGVCITGRRLTRNEEHHQWIATKTA